MIYPHIRAGRQAGGTLHQCLRRRGKKPNWRGGRHAGRGHIPDRVDIAERPTMVEEKSRVGDWEPDTVLGARHSGDPPERLRSAPGYWTHLCIGRSLRSGSPAVEIAAIRGQKEAFDARIFGSPPRSSLRATPSFWDRGTVALRTGPGAIKPPITDS